MFCSYCGTQIVEQVDVCPKCGRSASGVNEGAEGCLKWVVPVNRSNWAIAAGYLGLVSVLPGMGVLAVVCGCLALRSIQRNPRKIGKGRAYFGIVSGALFTVLELILLVL